MDIAKRLETPGRISTCSNKLNKSDEDDIIEPEIDVCAGDEENIAEDPEHPEDVEVKPDLTQDFSRVFCGFSIEQLMRK